MLFGQEPITMTRRDYLQLVAAGAAATATTRTLIAAGGDADREQRMKWWHEARFGMFIHWGLYSVLGRHEWVMENEGIPVAEYEQTRQAASSPSRTRRAIGRKLAKAAGQKYMVMTTKHHEGFCHFDSKLTDYCAPKQGPGRDLVKEYVEAARAEGMRVGFYYSLMDWHHPDGARCATDEAAPQALRRLHPRPDPRTADQLRQDRHSLVRRLLAARRQRLGIGKDERDGLRASARASSSTTAISSTAISPRRSSASPPSKRAWESCMTMNDSWGYQTRRRRLEDAQDHRAKPDHLRPRQRQLSAEHRAQARWLHPRGIGQAS